MKLEIFRTMWGYTASRTQALDELLEAGFDGMEARLPLTPVERAELGAFLRANHLPYIATVFTAYDVLPEQSATTAEHLLDLEKKLAWSTELSPRFVNVLAGNDRWQLPQ